MNTRSATLRQKQPVNPAGPRDTGCCRPEDAASVRPLLRAWVILCDVADQVMQLLKYLQGFDRFPPPICADTFGATRKRRILELLI